MQPRLRVCPALAYTRESGNPSEKLVMGKSGLSGRGRKDGGHRIDCLDLKGVCLEGAGGHWVVGKAGASLEVAEGRQGWARERCGRPRS